MQIKICGLVITALVAGCGGHKRSVPVVTDTQGPVMTGVSTRATGPGNVTLTASASDNSAVTGYCFSTSTATPTASDACFQASNQKAINLNPSAQQRYYVWAKDATGNVSSAPSVGPCSSAGFTLSDTSAPSLKTVCMMTSVGEMVLGLEYTKAPNTVANFLKYVNDGFYSNTVFHRVMSDFMVQGGGYNWTSAGGFAAKTPTYAPIAMELPSTTTLSNTSNTIAMARTSDPDSATSQFFINVVDNSGSPNKFDSDNPYAVFGKVISGDTTTLSSIKNVSVVSNNASPPQTPEISVPVNPPVILWAIQLK